MFKNVLTQSLSLLKNPSFYGLARREIAPINGFNSIHSSAILENNKSSGKSKKEKESDEDLAYQQDLSSGIRGLERLGLAKSHWSWPKYNRVIYPPGEDGNPTKTPIRGMTIDEAIKQLSFHKLKGAGIIKEVLLETQELAVREHNFEFKSNMWISYSSVSRALKVRGVRKHMGTRMGLMEYQYSHYYVRVEEGKPPADYHSLYSETYEARAKEYIEQLRKRSIYLSI